MRTKMSAGSVVAFAVLSILVGSGCGSPSDSVAEQPSAETTTGTPTTSATAVPEPVCPSVTPIENPDLAAAVATVPIGGIVTHARYRKDNQQPGMFEVAIDICDLAVTNDAQLRPIATQYAKAVKTSPLTETVSVMYVANNYVLGDDMEITKLKDPDFQVHLWNGKPSPAAELERWELLPG